jgi:hypothetical protein
MNREWRGPISVLCIILNEEVGLMNLCGHSIGNRITGKGAHLLAGAFKGSLLMTSLVLDGNVHGNNHSWAPC